MSLFILSLDELSIPSRLVISIRTDRPAQPSQSQVQTLVFFFSFFKVCELHQRFESVSMKKRLQGHKLDPTSRNSLVVVGCWLPFFLALVNVVEQMDTSWKERNLSST